MKEIKQLFTTDLNENYFEVTDKIKPRLRTSNNALKSYENGLYVEPVPVDTLTTRYCMRNNRVLKTFDGGVGDYSLLSSTQTIPEFANLVIVFMKDTISYTDHAIVNMESKVRRGLSVGTAWNDIEYTLDLPNRKIIIHKLPTNVKLKRILIV